MTNKKYRNNCLHCGKEYHGFSKNFCSRKCVCEFNNLTQHTIIENELVSDYKSFETPSFTGDAIVTGDWQLPFVSTQWLTRVIEASKYMDIHDLYIMGDLFDMGAFGRFKPSSAWPDDRDYADKLFRLLEKHFKRILWFMGNHEDRFFRSSGHKLSCIDLARIFGMVDRLIVYPYAMCEINDTYRLTHPENYSQTTAGLRDLANKYLRNMLVFHCHYNGLEWTKSGRNFIATIGMMADRKKLEYTNVIDTKYPFQQNGFAIIKDNKFIQVHQEFDFRFIYNYGGSNGY